MRIYLAGPMTGIRDWNRPAFRAAAALLRGRGLEVVNPAESFGGRVLEGRPREAYLRAGLRALLECDAVVVLPGWEESAGARMEVLVARELGLPVRDIDAPRWRKHRRWGGVRRVEDVVAARIFGETGSESGAGMRRCGVDARCLLRRGHAGECVEG